MRRTIAAISMAIILGTAGLAQEEQKPPKAPKPPRPPRAQRYVVAPDAEKKVVVVSEGGAYLGVDVRDVSSDRVSALKLQEERGVEITMVDQDAPAGKAGLKEHDVILSFNGQRVESAEQLRRMIKETPPGRTVALGISRDGQPLTLKTELAERKKYISGPMRIRVPEVVIPPMDFDFDFPAISMLQHSRRNGMVVESLTSQLGDFFGVKNGQGVLVRSVEKGSPAEAAGFKAGDVIVSVGKERVSDASDWNRLMRRHAGGNVTVGIVRERKQQSLSMTLPERRSREESSLEFTIPELNFDFEGLGEEIESEVRAALESERMIALHRGAMESAQRELTGIGPEVQRALREAATEVRAELEKQRTELRRKQECQRKQLQQELQRQREQLKNLRSRPLQVI